MPEPGIYISQTAGGPSLNARVAVPDYPGGSEIGAALAGLGESLSGLGRAVAAGREEVETARAQTDFLTRDYELQKRFQNDPDYAGAPARYSEERQALEREILARPFSEGTRAQLQLSFRRSGLASQGQVDGAALARMGSAYAATADAQEAQFFTRLRQANTETQRSQVLAEWDRLYSGGVDKGLMTPQAAEARKERRDRLIDQADLLALADQDPKAAVAALADPTRFAHLSPVERETLRQAAVAGGDQMAIDVIVNRSRFNPAAASLTLGRVVDPRHVDIVFNEGLVAQESGGDPSAVSPKGALGLAQLLPSTAREMAAKLGLTDVAKLSDAELKDKLLADSSLNADLGRAYLKDMVTRYDGSLPLALAAYNAGPDRADRWRKAAEAEFGPGFTPAELVSVIDIAETKGYVTAIYGRMGAPLDSGLSPNAAFKAATAVGQVLSADQRTRDQAVISLASIHRSGDATLDALKEGLPVAAESYLAELQIQEAAAAAGSPEAASRVVFLKEAWANKPLTDQAYALPPAALDAAITAGRQTLAASGDTTGPAYRRLKAFEAVAAVVKAKAGTDSVGLAARAGLVSGAPIDPAGDFADPALRRALTLRDSEAKTAAARFEVPLTPFRPEEAAALKARFSEAQDGDKLSILAGLASSLSPESYRAAIEQLADGEGLTRAVGLIARDRPEVAARVLRGAALLKTEGIDKDAATVREAFSATLAGDLFPIAGDLASVVDPALAYWVAARGANASLWGTPDEASLKEAVAAVAGEPTRRGGTLVLAPPGMSATVFNGILDDLNQADLPPPLRRFANETPPKNAPTDARGEPFDIGELGRRAILKQVEPFSGVYGVLMPSASGFAAVRTADGHPLFLDFSTIGPRGRKAADRRRGPTTGDLRRLPPFGGE